MKHKVIAALIVGFSLLLPTVAFAETEPVFDYSNGLLDQVDFSVSDPKINALFDNDLSTRFNSGFRSGVLVLMEPINIDKVWLHNLGQPSYSGNARMTFFSNDNVVLDLDVYRGFREMDRSYNVNLRGIDKIEVYNGSDFPLLAYEMDFEGSVFNPDEALPGEPGDTIPPKEVSNVKVDTTEDSATINFNNPTDIDFDKVNLYLAGQVYSSSNGQIYIDGLNEKTTYTAIVKTVDTLGNESEGVEVQFTTKETPTVPPETPQQVPEVKNLQVETDGERVDLSWNNPPQFFEKATIYRKDLGNTAAAGFKFNLFAPATVSASADFKPLFETNGTTFSDLSINPETDYEYKVTNTFNGMESQGVIVQASVPKPPLVNTDDVKVPFGASELIKTGNGLLGFVGGFILLALSFVLVPKIIAVIKNANAGTNGSSRAERVGRVQREAIQPRLTDRQMNMATGNAREGRQPRLTKRQMKGV